MKVADAMTRNPMTVQSDATVIDALRRMLAARISGLPVMDGSGTLVGMITEGDFLRRAELGTERQHSKLLEFVLGPGRLAQEYVGSHGRQVAEVMSGRVVAVDQDAPLGDAVRLMEHHHIKRLPVTCQGRLVGILSRADLLNAVVKAADAEIPAGASDVAIRHRILAEIDRNPWGPRASVRVEVRNGEVHLSGVLIDERTRDALKVLAENVPGVVRVHDHVTSVEPLSGFVIEAPVGS